MITWAIPHQLARSPRPGHQSIPVKAVEFDSWMNQAETLNIRSVICLLSKQELHDYYLYAGIDLIKRYKASGLESAHFPVSDCFTPAESEEILPRIGEFYQRAAKPCLVHCSAGMTRTGTVIDYLVRIYASLPSR